MFLNGLFSKEYIFSIDTEGTIQNYKFENKDNIYIKGIGNRMAYKFHTSEPSEINIWIDEKDKVILKKEENISGGNVLTTILDKYE
jgi:hypothetical protein